VTTTPTLLCHRCSLSPSLCPCICSVCHEDFSAQPECLGCATKDATCPGCGEEKFPDATTCGATYCVREIREEWR